jgi:hypothetical protein
VGGRAHAQGLLSALAGATGLSLGLAAWLVVRGPIPATPAARPDAPRASASGVGSPWAPASRVLVAGAAVRGAADPRRTPPAGAAPAEDDRGERELRRAFVERQRSEPSWLERHAREGLASQGPDARKVALLRALEDSGSPELVAWLEHAVTTLPSQATARAESVPAFALRRLQDRAAHEPQARSALRRIAFGSRDLPTHLRLRAAAAAAAACDQGELALLELDLRREPEQAVVEAALAALAGRGGEGHVRRLLDAFPAATSAPATALEVVE